MKTWDDLKKEGSSHYKTSSTEPIDLYKSKGVFKHFALCSIVKYATRNMGQPLRIADMTKIIHYAELLIAEDVEIQNVVVNFTPPNGKSRF